MYNATNLLFYAENCVFFQDRVKSLIVECGIPFKELSSMSHLFSALENSYNRVVLLIDSAELFDTVINFVQANPNCASRVFIVRPFQATYSGFFDNVCSEHNLDKLKIFLCEKFKIQDPSQLSQPSLLCKLVRLELEKLGISKKYVGFKYLVDIILNAIIKDYHNAYDMELFKVVAKVNSCSPDLIERDIRHMLTSTWNNNLKFQKLLLNLSCLQNNINSKFILNNLILYLKSKI